MKISGPVLSMRIACASDFQVNDAAVTLANVTSYFKSDARMRICKYEPCVFLKKTFSRT